MQRRRERINGVCLYSQLNGYVLQRTARDETTTFSENANLQRFPQTVET